MEKKHRNSLIFWVFISLILGVIPWLLFTFDVGIEEYFHILKWALLFVFGPGVPLYLISKIFVYSRCAKHSHQNSNHKLTIGIVLMSLTAILWSMFLVNLWLFSHPGGGEGIGFAFSIIPLLLLGGIGEKFVKSGTLNQKRA